MQDKARIGRAGALLAGTTVGSGIIGVPYAVAQAGFVVGVGYLVVLGGAMLLLNILFASLVAHTPGVHQLPGYVDRYLGRRWRLLMLVTLMGLGYGALTAYTVGSGSALAELLNTSQGFTRAGFLAVAALFVWVGVKAVSKLELLLVILITGLIGAVAAVAFADPSFSGANLSYIGSPASWLTPYGVVIFAYLGFSSIPELKLILPQNTKGLYYATALGTLLPVVLYTVFVTAVVGVTGADTTEVATLGLGSALGFNIALTGNVFAVLAMFTSFLALALVMKDMFEFDLNLTNAQSFVLTFAPPLLLLAAGAENFIALLSLTGALSGGVMGVLVVIMYLKLQNTRYNAWSRRLKLLAAGGVGIIVLLILGMVASAVNV